MLIESTTEFGPEAKLSIMRRSTTFDGSWEGPSTLFWQQNMRQIEYRRMRWGTVTENYRQLVADGTILQTNPYLDVEVAQSGANGGAPGSNWSFRTTHGMIIDEYTFDFAPGYYPLQIIPDALPITHGYEKQPEDLAVEALEGLYRKLQEAQTDTLTNVFQLRMTLDLATSVCAGLQTVNDLARNPVKGLKELQKVARGLRMKKYNRDQFLKRANLSTMGSVTGNRGVNRLSQAYLAYIYGLVPLWRDLLTVVETVLDKSKRQTGDISHVKGYFATTSGPLVPFTRDTVYTPISGHPQTLRTHIRGNIRTRMRYGCTVLHTDPVTNGDRLFASPVKVMVENVPFSFILDWMINLSEWLEAKTALDGKVVLAGYSEVISEYDVVESGEGYVFDFEVDLGGGPVRYHSDGVTVKSTTSTIRSYTRNPEVAFPLPSLRWKPHFTVKRAFAALALLKLSSIGRDVLGLRYKTIK